MLKSALVMLMMPGKTLEVWHSEAAFHGLRRKASLIRNRD